MPCSPKVLLAQTCCLEQAVTADCLDRIADCEAEHVERFPVPRCSSTIAYPVWTARSSFGPTQLLCSGVKFTSPAILRRCFFKTTRRGPARSIVSSSDLAAEVICAASLARNRRNKRLCH